LVGAAFSQENPKITSALRKMSHHPCIPSSSYTYCSPPYALRSADHK
jgi:hypothetical protein